MPRFEFNPNDIQVGFPVYPKDTYEIEIGEPKCQFFAAKEAGKEDRVMLGYPCRIAEGPNKGKPYYLSFDLNNQYGQQNAKSAVMASKGIEPKDENLASFNEQYGDLDASVNTDERTVGEFWHLAKGGRILVDLDTDIKDGKQVQKFPTNLRPVG